jgi:hypothetical protein
MSKRKKIVLSIVGGFVGLSIIGAIADGGTKKADPAALASAAAATDTTFVESSAPAPVEESAPDETTGQENARKSAEDYLDGPSSFSRKSLIDQLKFEDYSVADATYAVDAVNPDWNEQAAKSAQDYMDGQSFSQSGLIDQLEFEGFTPAQAEYGASQAGY